MCPLWCWYKKANSLRSVKGTDSQGSWLAEVGIFMVRKKRTSVTSSEVGSDFEQEKEKEKKKSWNSRSTINLSLTLTRSNTKKELTRCRVNSVIWPVCKVPSTIIFLQLALPLMVELHIYIYSLLFRKKYIKNSKYSFFSTSLI